MDTSVAWSIKQCDLVMLCVERSNANIDGHSSASLCFVLV